MKIEVYLIANCSVYRIIGIGGAKPQSEYKVANIDGKWTKESNLGRSKRRRG